MSAKNKRKRLLVVSVLSILQYVWVILWVAVHCLLMAWISKPDWVIFQLPLWAKWLAWVFWLLGGACLLFYLKWLTEAKLEQAGRGIRASKSALRESTQNDQVEDKRMTTTRDTDNRVVTHFPIWLRVLGGFSFLFGVGISYALAPFIRESTTALIPIFCIGLPALYLGIWFMGYTFQLTFDHTHGIMTIRTDIGPFAYRTRHISRKQVENVSVIQTGGTSGVPGDVPIWAVSLRVSERKREIKIINYIGKSRANYIANRITAFLE